MKKYMKDVIFENRKKLNLTQEELALKLNVSNKTVSKWERGLSYPDVLLIPKLSEVLKITINELYDVDEVKENIGDSKDFILIQKFKKAILLSLLIFISSPALYLLSLAFSMTIEFTTLSLFIGCIMLIFSLVFSIYKTIEMIILIKEKKEYQNILIKYSLYFCLFVYVVLSLFVLFFNGMLAFILGTILYILFILIPIIYIFIYKINIISKKNIIVSSVSLVLVLISIIYIVIKVVSPGPVHITYGGNGYHTKIFSANVSIFCYIISQIINYSILLISSKKLKYKDL